jgi:uncharacterized protein DUF2726
MLKRLSNKGEIDVFKQISPVADRYRSSIYRKMRAADIVDIGRLDGSSLRKYALMAHFDFVVADENEQPLFAVEFDGPGHSPLHNAEKDQICRLADLALFRVDLRSSRLETAQLSLLEYLVHLWFLGNQFREMRATGVVSEDEAFIMSSFLRSDAKNVFDSEFDLLGSARSKLYSYCKKNGLPGRPDLLASVLLAQDDSGYFAFCSLPVKVTKLYGRAAFCLKTPHLGAPADLFFARQEIGQFCAALAIEDLIDEIGRYLSGAGHAVRLRDDIMTEMTELKHRGHKYLLGFHGGDNDELCRAAQ